MFLIKGIAEYAPEKKGVPEFLINIPLLNLMTQAESKDECLEMAEDIINLSLDTSVKVFWTDKEQGVFTVEIEDSVAIPAILKASRVKAHLTQAQLAKELNLKSQNSVYDWESGNKMPSIKKFFEILRACKVRAALEDVAV